MYFPIYIPLISFSCLIALGKISSTVLNRHGESHHPCLVFNFSRNVEVFLHLSWYWLWACYMAFIILKVSSMSLNSPGPLSWMDVGVCKRPCLHLMWWSHGFSPWVCLYGTLHLCMLTLFLYDCTIQQHELNTFYLSIPLVLDT